MRVSLCLALACVVSHAHTGSKPQFEVASVKPAVPNRIHPRGPDVGGPGSSTPGEKSYFNMSLKDLVYRAYDAMPYQLSVPSWMEEGARFDIVAKVPAGTTKAGIPLMLQSLLEERFHLRVRHESREAPAYALTVGKNGPKMNEYPALLPSDFIEAARVSGVDKDGVYIVAPGYATGMMGSLNGGTQISIARQPIRELCKFLSRILQQPVVDQTGLTGRYDVRLHFATYQVSPSPAPSGEEGASSMAPEASDPAPTLFQALQTQAGLKLEPKRMPVDFLVVEYAEKSPTEN